MIEHEITIKNKKQRDDQEMQSKKLTGKESECIWNDSKCPDCHGDLLAGPRGGLSVNVKCKTCGNAFNVPPPGTFLVERIN
jgi:hypothetical protein